MRCPACRAENTMGPSCRRCRTDLSLLFDLEERRERALAAAARCVAIGEGGQAMRFAQEAHLIRRGPDAQRLLALAYLMQRDFASARQAYLSGQ